MSSSNHSRWVYIVAAILVVLPVASGLVLTWPGETPATSANLERSALAVGVLLAALIGGALALLFLALVETAGGGPPSLETSWGGFGGGLGGWNLSPALTYLLAALFLGGLFGVLASQVAESPAFHTWAGMPEPGEPEEIEEDEEPAEKIEDDGGTAEGEDGADVPTEGDATEPATSSPATEG
jgi:hypothetical protein